MMPEVNLSIGGRNFRVSCQVGEEAQLEQAAALLDNEADALEKAIGRVPEPRMLLMAGLMLADRTIEVAGRIQSAEEEIATLRDQLRKAEAKAAQPAQANSATERQAIKALEAAASRAERLAGISG